MTRILLALIVIWTAISLLSCSIAPYVKPTHTDTYLRVRWSTPDQIRAQCGDSAKACVSKGIVWTEMPRDFEDFERVCVLGHEVLHRLGAKH